MAACLSGPESSLKACLQKIPSVDASGQEEAAVVKAPGESKWHTQTKTDKLDNSTTVFAGVESSDRLTSSFGQSDSATIVVRCLKNTTEVYVNWPQFIGIGKEREVKWRVDGQPVAAEWWSPSNDGTAVFAPAPVPFLKKLIGGRELILSVSPYSKVASSLTFPISGAEQALKPIRDTCKW